MYCTRVDSEILVPPAIMTAGEDDEGQKLWSWGAGTEGQLATGDLHDGHLPRPVSFPRRPVSQIACGGAHAVALAGGEVVSWGRGSSGQLGHGDLLNRLVPEPVKFFKDCCVVNISAGWNHSGFVSVEGHLFTCGDGSFGQLGLGDCESHCIPVEVGFFSSMNVQQVACGMRHTLTLVHDLSENKVYGFGLGSRGQLGTPVDKNRRFLSLPQVISIFIDDEIDKVHANGDQSAALSVNKCLYTWGRGFSNSKFTSYPQRINALSPVSQVALGWNHALLLTDAHEVLMLGGTRHGLLSRPQTTSMEEGSLQECREPLLQKVQGLEGKLIKLISAGAEHSVVITEDGEIMTWGWGEHGQLGLGDSEDRVRPQIVSLGTGRSEANSWLSINCGSGFCFAVMSGLTDSEH